MKPSYNDFSAQLFGLIQMEGRARSTVDRNGFRNHFDASESFPFLVSLARSIAGEYRRGGIDLTEPQKTAVSFVLHVDARRFNHFLQNLHGRYYIAEGFYPLSVEEYCYPRRESCPLLRWTAEAFNPDEGDEEGGAPLTWNDILAASIIQTYGD